MPKSRTMGAGLASSTRKGSRSNVRSIQGGNKLQGLPGITNKRVGAVRAINNKAYGDNRDVVFCMNQLGGIGAVSGGNGSRMFGATSDGVKDCITGPYGCEHIVQEAYQAIFSRDPDASGLRTYCLAITKRKWTIEDIKDDLIKNGDSTIIIPDHDDLVKYKNHEFEHTLKEIYVYPDSYTHTDGEINFSIHPQPLSLKEANYWKGHARDYVEGKEYPTSVTSTHIFETIMIPHQHVYVSHKDKKGRRIGKIHKYKNAMAKHFGSRTDRSYKRYNEAFLLKHKKNIWKLMGLNEETGETITLKDDNGDDIINSATGKPFYRQFYTRSAVLNAIWMVAGSTLTSSDEIYDLALDYLEGGKAYAHFVLQSDKQLGVDFPFSDEDKKKADQMVHKVLSHDKLTPGYVPGNNNTLGSSNNTLGGEYVQTCEDGAVVDAAGRCGCTPVCEYGITITDSNGNSIVNTNFDNGLEVCFAQGPTDVTRLGSLPAASVDVDINFLQGVGQVCLCLNSFKDCSLDSVSCDNNKASVTFFAEIKGSVAWDGIAVYYFKDSGPQICVSSGNGSASYSGGLGVTISNLRFEFPSFEVGYQDLKIKVGGTNFVADAHDLGLPDISKYSKNILSNPFGPTNYQGDMTFQVKCEGSLPLVDGKSEAMESNNWEENTKLNCSASGCVYLSDIAGSNGGQYTNCWWDYKNIQSGNGSNVSQKYGYKHVLPTHTSVNMNKAWSTWGYNVKAIEDSSSDPQFYFSVVNWQVVSGTNGKFNSSMNPNTDANTGSYIPNRNTLLQYFSDNQFPNGCTGNNSNACPNGSIVGYTVEIPYGTVSTKIGAALILDADSFDLTIDRDNAVVSLCMNGSADLKNGVGDNGLWLGISFPIKVTFNQLKFDYWLQYPDLDYPTSRANSTVGTLIQFDTGIGELDFTFNTKVQLTL